MRPLSEPSLTFPDFTPADLGLCVALRVRFVCTGACAPSTARDSSRSSSSLRRFSGRGCSPLILIDSDDNVPELVPDTDNHWWNRQVTDDHTPLPTPPPSPARFLRPGSSNPNLSNPTNTQPDQEQPPSYNRTNPEPLEGQHIAFQRHLRTQLNNRKKHKTRHIRFIVKHSD